MLAFLPEYEPTLGSPCPVQVETLRSQNRDPGTRTPEMPRLVCPAACSRAEDELYPIHTLWSPPTTQITRLCSIVLITPIHVHTPDAHIGTIHGDFPGEKINAYGLVTFLQGLVLRAISLDDVYSHLPLAMKDQVRSSFLLRMKSSTNAMRCWDEFISGGRSEDCWPIVLDLLLGNDQVWGLEGVAFGGYSVIHFA